MSGACIPKYFECDHEFDCPDNSDEHSDCGKSIFFIFRSIRCKYHVQLQPPATLSPSPAPTASAWTGASYATARTTVETIPTNPLAKKSKKPATQTNSLAPCTPRCASRTPPAATALRSVPTTKTNKTVPTVKSTSSLVRTANAFQRSGPATGPTTAATAQTKTP